MSVSVPDYVPELIPDSLLERSWQLFRRFEARDFIVSPAVPIAWFGDTERYFKSSRRIVSVGLNPSLAEFPTTDHFMRFPAAREFYTFTGTQQYSLLRTSLNEYFRHVPYRDWFNSIEPILNGMGASFYRTHNDSCVHTDLLAPIATNPTWSQLSSVHQLELAKEGIPLWKDTVRLLRPHLLLISVAQKYIPLSGLPDLASWKELHTFYKKKPFTYRITVLELGDFQALGVFGPAAQKPFSFISDDEKRWLSGKIASQLDAAEFET